MHHKHGFTLVEIAIVIFILGLMIAGLVGPFEVQMEARYRRETLDMMNDAADALYGYALTNRRLPCRDSDGDGLPNPPYDSTIKANATCTPDNGFLPWSKLGVSQGDAWGNRFTYQVVNPTYTWPAQDTACNGDITFEFDLCAQGDLTIVSRGDDPSTAGTTEGKYELDPWIIEENVVAVIVSHGKNGFGATSVDGVARPAVPASHDDEQENADDGADKEYFRRTYSRGEAECEDDDDEAVPLCEFDDMVVHLSRTILNSRMVAAGQLP